MASVPGGISSGPNIAGGTGFTTYGGGTGTSAGGGNTIIDHSITVNGGDPQAGMNAAQQAQISSQRTQALGSISNAGNLPR